MSKLNNILEELYYAGLQQLDKPQKRALNKGLHITVTCHTESTTLIIARDREYPSEKEWETVCNYFPYYVANPTPAKIIDTDQRLALKAELPRRTITQLSFT